MSKRYLIFEASSREDLMKQISKELSKGGICQGGISVLQEEYTQIAHCAGFSATVPVKRIMYYQAMLVEPINEV